MKFLCAVRLSPLKIIAAQLRFRLPADLSAADRAGTEFCIARRADFFLAHVLSARCSLQGFAVRLCFVLSLSLSLSLSVSLWPLMVLLLGLARFLRVFESLLHAVSLPAVCTRSFSRPYVLGLVCCYVV